MTLKNTTEDTKMEDFLEQREKDYEIARRLIRFPMRRAEKYYYAFQCQLFEQNVKAFGFDHVATRAKAHAEGIQFHAHSITLGNQYSYDLKRFNNKDEMFGFVIGYNEAILNTKINEVTA